MRKLEKNIKTALQEGKIKKISIPAKRRIKTRDLVECVPCEGPCRYLVAYTRKITQNRSSNYFFCEFGKSKRTRCPGHRPVDYSDVQDKFELSDNLWNKRRSQYYSRIDQLVESIFAGEKLANSQSVADIFETPMTNVQVKRITPIEYRTLIRESQLTGLISDFDIVMAPSVRCDARLSSQLDDNDIVSEEVEEAIREGKGHVGRHTKWRDQDFREGYTAWQPFIPRSRG